MAYSTRVRYGLRLLVNLATQGVDRYVSIAEIAEGEGVSTKYLEQIVNLLRPLGILTSLRGARGGYALVCNPSEISLESVFDSLGELPPPVPCAHMAGVCERMPACATRPFWLDFDRHIRGYLRSRTLADLIGNANQANDIYLFSAPLDVAAPSPRSSGGLTPSRTARKRKSF